MSHPSAMLWDQKVKLNLIWAVRKGSLERTRQLINSFGLYYSPAWCGGYVLLCDALKFRHEKIAKLLLMRGAEVNPKEEYPTNTPLHFAARNGDVEIVKMILERGGRVNVKNIYGKTPLCRAIENKIKIFEFLLRHNISASPVDIKAVKSYIQIVELLVTHGADVNYVGNSCRRKSYSPLHFAIEIDSKHTVTLLLDKGANSNIKGDDDISPLHIAGRNGNVFMIQVLLDHGAYIQSLTLNQRYTPLHFACEAGKEEAVKLFLKNNADKNARTINNLTPLHVAVMNGHKKIVKLLLQHGAKVDVEDADHKTILYAAVEKGYSIIVQDILKYCPDKNNQSNRNCIKVAIKGCGAECKKIGEALLEYGFICNTEDINDDLLHAAIKNGYLKIVEDVLKSSVDDNNNSKYNEGFTLLHTAAKYKQEAVAKLLINCKADINATDIMGRTPIFYAIDNADLKMTKLLLKNKADIQNNDDLLHTAVQKESLEIIKLLLQHDADVNASDCYGRTPLHFTIFYDIYNEEDLDNKIKIVEFLLTRGANLDIKTKIGKSTLSAAIENAHIEVVDVFLKHTPNVNFEEGLDMPLLHHCVERRNEEICLMLLKKGANVNAKQTDGRTALHIAAEYGDEVIVNLLLEYGANVNSKTKSVMMTPLHSASYCYNGAKIIESLLKFGACIDFQDAYGETALHIAFQNENMEIIKVLLDNGADINITNEDDQTYFEVLDDHIDEFDEDVYEMLVNTLKFHTVKLKAANLYVSEKNLQSLSNSDEINDFQDQCEQEVAMMKSEEINNQKISFYDILTKDASSLAKYMRNESILEVLESGTHKIIYPIYGNMVECHFVKSIKRKELVEQASRIFNILFNDLPNLPYLCIDELFSYLSNEDLQILEETFYSLHQKYQL